MSIDRSASTSAEDPMAAEWAEALEEHQDRTGLRSRWNRPSRVAPLAGEGVRPFVGKDGTAPQDINMVLDIPVHLVGGAGAHASIPIKHILQLAQGSVVELDALAGEPMDVLVNGYLIAQGEVVVVNDKFGIRLTDIVTPSASACAA